MTLAVGAGPLGSPGGHSNLGSRCAYVWYWEAWPRRMRAVFGSATVVDSRRAMLLYESGSLIPEHCYPVADLRRDVLVERERVDEGTGRGVVRRFDVCVDGRVAPGAVTAYYAPNPDAPPLGGYATIDFAAMDHWFEEDDPIYAHPRDPYHRVDVRASSRHVVVRCGDTVVAETARPKLLFETANPVRFYVPSADVRLDLLEPSSYVSQCPYKGDGQHWHVVDGATRVENGAWSLPHPLPEGLAAAEHVCFYPEKLEVAVDGVPIGV